MPALPAIKTLFANDIHRRIEEVIKVDQTDDEILRDEIGEYVVTDAIRRHFAEVLERYQTTPNKPHEGIAVWVSGFFGSGKSSFAKMLGLAIENRRIADEPGAQRFVARAGDKRIQVMLAAITEQIPTHAVIFDVSTDRGIKSGNQTLTEIMYGLFLQSLGYAKDLDLSEMEITLEAREQLAAFKAKYQEIFKKSWDAEKGKVAFALSEASRVLHALEPDTYPMADSWVKAVKNKADISPGKLAERCGELMRRNKPGYSLLFVIDEVGQFVARDVQKMLDLQAIVQSLGVRGRGKHWIVVTSQEKLGELVSGLDDKKIELARLMDRFPSQVHLEPSDISEVTSRRVLAKNAAAQEALGKLFDEHRGRLTENTRLAADIKLPELTRDGFVDLYPLLPYQIDLVIQVVSGLRTQGGASRHVGGANRTIIKLAQQLLINPATQLAEQPLGVLARIDHVYDLVDGNIDGDVRAKIAAIPKQTEHPLAQAVAKAICLLQYVKTIHRTAENIAATLHPAVAGDSQLVTVKEALAELVMRHLVRLGDDGYRIPTPAEDDWERTRNGISPRPGDAHRLHAEVLTSFWQPQPQHNFLDTKLFKAGLVLQGRELVEGDTMFHLHLADDAKAFAELANELRARSQQEKKHVFWAVALNEAIDRETVEVFRSKEMIARKEREAKTDVKDRLIPEEKNRQRRHMDDLKRLLKTACLSGAVYFRGNDRSPTDRAVDVGKAAAEILGQALPLVFDRFKEAAARVGKKDLDALCTSENLHGLTPVFSQLGLLRTERGQVVFQTDKGPLGEVMGRILDRADYGESPSGRYLTDELAKEPFGWDFDVVRLFVVCLLRAGKIEATSKSQTIDNAVTIEARDTFSNNNLFRQASFRPKRSVDFEALVKAAEGFRDTFGSEVKELSAGVIVQDLRRELTRHEDTVMEALSRLNAERLPGGSMLEMALSQMKAIQRGSEDNAIEIFNSSHRAIKDAIRRAAELTQALTEPRLRDVARAKQALTVIWPFLASEQDLDEAFRGRAAALEDLLARETFFRDMPAIEQHTRALELEYARRRDDALQARVNAYTKAFERLTKAPGWAELDKDSQHSIAEPLKQGMSRTAEPVAIPLLRSERDACESRLRVAVQAVHRAREGDRVASVDLSSYFAGGIESEEQLDAALNGIREECARLIGAGKKVIAS
ncbi:BREX system P-loop protein BrxC [Sorangium sp. So ce295]|uniref:BREX system P-loop protein BrxC n=1 Tax=Sorangium sp. So ce295 TaxID=3133295 RepID=UPI003F61CEA2